MDFAALERLETKTAEQEKLIERFYRYCPVTIISSPMNLLCRCIEGVDFEVARHTRIPAAAAVYELYKCRQLDYQDYYEPVRQELRQYLKERRQAAVLMTDDRAEFGFDRDKAGSFDTVSENLYERLSGVHPNPNVILNCLVDYYYQEKPAANKDLLWKAYGKYIYRNVIRNTPQNQTVLFPFPAGPEDYDLTYLGYHYKLQEVSI